MKKLILIFTAFALLCVLVGCDASTVKEKLDRAEDQIERAENEIENALNKAENAFDQVGERVENALNPTSSELMSEEEAENIAIEHVKLTRQQVKDVHTEYEYENGMHKYEIEFSSEEWEYEFEIHAENGSILSFDKASVWG